MQISR